MRRGRRLVGLDQADLVLVAAEVLSEEPDVIVDRADVGVLTGIAARLPDIDDLAEATAEVLVAVAAGRPFGRDDGAVAWLAATVLVERNGHTIEGDDDDWVRLVRAAAAGTVAEREVADALAPGLRPARGRLRRFVAAACEPRECPQPSSYPCPACGAEVERSAIWRFPACGVPSHAELVATCARRSATHHRDGSPRPEPERPTPSRWCPVVTARDEGSFLALTDDGPLAFRPIEAGRAYEVLAVDELTPSDLVGSWSNVWDHGRPVGRVRAELCHVDDGTRLDWPRVADALVSARELVPA